MNTTGRPNARRGFTLIEMLVVISIIAILAAFLLPALLGVRERGYAAYCQNNLRNLAMAMRKYTMLYDGCFPCDYDLPYTGYSEYPVEQMSRMMGLIQQPFSSGGQAPKVVLCPSCKASPADGEDYLCRHYAVNGHLDSYPEAGYPGFPRHQDYETRVGADSFPRSPWGGFGWGYWVNFQPYKIDYVRAPERVMVFADSNDEVDSYAQQWWVKYQWRFGATICYACRPTRHRGGGNLAFLDGHVAWQSRDTFRDWNKQCQWLVDPDVHNDNAWWDSNFGN